ncbi:glycosyltransferase [Deinococcus radiopugnans]|uniref:glycosyltransferase n=1 Tax=Deinococcus radiopugnans TaxID=57497 RepID=UPI0009DF6CBA|nr:glycosyltransferase [Deinococcus radiopugnans]
MKIALLGSARSIHVIRWANGLSTLGHKVYVLSLHGLAHNLDEEVTLVQIAPRAPFGYFLAFSDVKRALERIAPDILNTHYATGYGLLGTLSRFKPTLLSVWGSDVYDFPRKSPLHLLLLRWILKNATAIGSTSYCMARQTESVLKDKQIYVTPFGIDAKFFIDNIRRVDSMESKKRDVVIGTVKTLQNKYGIDTLIKAFQIAQNRIGDKYNLHLKIYGNGSDLGNLMKLAEELDVKNRVDFLGNIKHSEVPVALAEMDIYMALSRFDSESFGVAVLEAGACSLPVIVSDAQGLAEVVVNNETGLIVPKENAEAAANALIYLIENQEVRIAMGRNGRKHVKEKYSWEHSLETMINAYSATIEIAKQGKQ